MRNLLLYILSVLVIFTSCIKEVEDISLYQVDGMWVSVNEDATMNVLVEFKDGAYREYSSDSEVKFYHSDRLWNTRIEDLDKKVYQYSISDGKLLLNGADDQSISISRDTLYLGNTKYQFVEELVPDYGSHLDLPFLDGDAGSVNIPSYSQVIIWNYEVSDIPKNTYLGVSADADWIHSIEVDPERIKFSVDENITSEVRTAVLALLHPACGVKEISITQPFTIYPASVETLEPEYVSYTSATLKGAIRDNGKGNIESCGFYFGPHPDSLTRHAVQRAGETELALPLNNLKPGCMYYYKAYAENESGESYGALLDFKTEQLKSPIVKTLAASEVGVVSAKVSGYVADYGGTPVIDYGFYYGQSPESLVKCSSAGDIYMFTAVFSELTDSCVYYYRAYATNEIGEGLGELLTFQTEKIYEPFVKTGSVTDLTASSGRIHGSVTSAGTGEITEYGFYYGLNPDNLTKKQIGTQIKENEDFFLDLNGLDKNTEYYYAAYSINEYVEGVGELKKFLTLLPPTAITSTEYKIDLSTITCGGSVSSDATSYGICWSLTDEVPTVEDNVIYSDGSKSGFTCKINGCKENADYYVRAFAKNSAGISYGKTVVIKSATLPTIKLNRNSSSCSLWGYEYTLSYQRPIFQMNFVFEVSNPSNLNIKVKYKLYDKYTGDTIGTGTCSKTGSHYSCSHRWTIDYLSYIEVQGYLEVEGTTVYADRVTFTLYY